MTRRKYAIGAAMTALTLCAGASVSISAISDSAPDDRNVGMRADAVVSSNWSEPTTTVVQVTIPPSSPPIAPERTLSANPLWAMPLTQFSVTRERPIFLASRRPPTPAVAPGIAPKVVAVPKPREPERPQFALVGTIAGDEEKFGIFVDQSTKAVVRLKVGEDFQGWKLQSIQGREASLEKSQAVVVLALPQPGLGQPAIAVRQEPVTSRPRGDR
ncbi:MAG TPA: hypothetical protein VKT76_06930 [Bradyrhizobium sp.]|nr:hypothetical protein [Bradyrhizobium sp.]